MTTCQYDTGTQYGNLPACDRSATASFTYRNGSYGPFRVSLCLRHASPMAARVFPSPLERVNGND